MVQIFRQIINIFLIATIIFSLDDILYDVISYIKRDKKSKKTIKIKDLDSVSPKLIAIFVAAWKEENVISDMLQNNLSMINYSKSSKYLLFIILLLYKSSIDCFSLSLLSIL
jgi:adsorption protein B